MKILVPLDGSALAEGVFPYLLSWVRETEGQVNLLRATDPFFSSPYGLPYEMAGELRQKIVATSQQYLTEVASRLGLRDFECWNVIGPAREEICRVAQELDCDLMVLSSHGHSGLSQWFLGNVAEGVIRTAPCPVLLVRQPPAQTSHFRHVLIPLDGTAVALEVVQKISPYLDGHSQVTLLTATGLSPHDYVEVSDRGDWQSYVEGLQENLRKVPVHGPQRIHTKVIDGEAGSSILSWAAEAGCDLIALSSHRDGALRRLLLGSVTQQVIRKANCSVLVFPPS